MDMKSENLAFGKINYILLAVGVIVIIAGFCLMSGNASSETMFNPDIFSFRRIKLAPVVTLFGFLWIIFAILYKPSSTQK